MSSDATPHIPAAREDGHASLVDADNKRTSNAEIPDKVTTPPTITLREDLDGDVSPLTLPPPRYPLAQKTFINRGDLFTFRPDRAPFVPPSTMAAQFSNVEMLPGFNVNQRPPFLNPLENLGLQQYGVLKLSNIPYTVTISEIKHLIKGMSEHTLIEDHHQGFSVHIIMEKSTGKTMECYVELQYHGAAADLAGKAQLRSSRGKAIKIGNRHIHFAVSSQGELAAALFPRAKSCVWDQVTGIPGIHDSKDPFSHGFHGFFTIEEMASIFKLAEGPMRAQFNNRSHSRPFESIISMLYKFPWKSAYHYTVNARNLLFTVYMHLLRILVEKVPPMTDPSTDTSNFSRVRPQVERQVGINHALLMDYLFAGLNVPCFSLRQKCHIVSNCGPIGFGFPLEYQAAEWPFQALSLPPRFPDRLLTMWLRIFKIGYRIMTNSGEKYEAEEFIRLAYDDLGHPIFALTDVGRTLHFAELIAIETGLMEKIMDKGRTKWCFDNGVPYIPMKVCEPFSYAYAVDSMPQAVQDFQIVHVDYAQSHKSHDPALEHNQRPMNGMRPARHPPRFYAQTAATPPSTQYRHKQNDFYMEASGCDTATFDGRQAFQSSGQEMASKALVPCSFNPATPSFVPSRQWSSSSRRMPQDYNAPANAPTAPRGHSVGNAAFPSAQTTGPTTAKSADSSDRSQATASFEEKHNTKTDSSSWSAGLNALDRFPGVGQHHHLGDPFGGLRWSPGPWSSDASRQVSNDRAHAPSSDAHNILDNNTAATRSRGGSTVRHGTPVVNLTIHEENSGDFDDGPQGEEMGGARLERK